jgi:hypothetical protein
MCDLTYGNYNLLPAQDNGSLRRIVREKLPPAVTVKNGNDNNALSTFIELGTGGVGKSYVHIKGRPRHPTAVRAGGHAHSD